MTGSYCLERFEAILEKRAVRNSLGLRLLSRLRLPALVEGAREGIRDEGAREGRREGPRAGVRETGWKSLMEGSRLIAGKMSVEGKGGTGLESGSLAACSMTDSAVCVACVLGGGLGGVRGGKNELRLLALVTG